MLDVDIMIEATVYSAVALKIGMQYPTWYYRATGEYRHNRLDVVTNLTDDIRHYLQDRFEITILGP